MSFVVTMMKSLILTSVLLVGRAVATSSEVLSDYEVFEELSGVPEPWVVKGNGQVDSGHRFTLRIHLKNQNIASFQQAVLDISTPGHASYGRHMSKAEVNDLLAPPQQSFETVRQWLDAFEGGSLSRNQTWNNDWVVVDTTIGTVEKLLQSNYQLFENTEDGKTTARTLSYSLPKELHSHIDIIAPTIKFSTPSKHRSTLVDFPTSADGLEFKTYTASNINADLAACNTSITPDCLFDLYGFRGFETSATNGNQFALAGFLEQYAQHDDLAKFSAKYAPAAVGSDFTEILVNGGLNTQQNTTNETIAMSEANLDIQYGLPIAYPIPTVYISTGGRPPETTPYEVSNEPYLEFLNFLLAADKIPQTISISYGDAEWTVPETYANTVCNLFSQIAARGTSVLVSSGDSGSGSNCSATSTTSLRYEPNFPAGCPFVTTVGATFHVQPEIAQGFSGGGFSNYFGRPAYQDAAVSAFLADPAKADPAFTQFFNQSGRAYPDVSAQGVRFHVFVRGSDVLESGTSASAPAFASIIALLNGDRISSGLQPFGLLNPWLYSNASTALTDIVSGKGQGCSQVNGSGFPATSGWDPVTGLGTPDFAKLRAASTGVAVSARKA